MTTGEKSVAHSGHDQEALEQTLAGGVRRGGGARGETQLGEQVRDVALDGVVAQAQPHRDVRIAQTLSHQSQDLELAPCELGLATRALRPRRALEPLESILGSPRVPLRAQRLERLERLACLALGGGVLP